MVTIDDWFLINDYIVDSWMPDRIHTIKIYPNNLLSMKAVQ